MCEKKKNKSERKGVGSQISEKYTEIIHVNAQ